MAKKRFYAVVNGHNPGIYQQWGGEGGAEAQVKGYHGALYRGFPGYDEAVHWFETKSGGVKPRLYGAPLASQTALMDDMPASRRTIPESLDYHAEIESGVIVIFTDGGSIDNPGPGGYGAVILSRDHRRELSGGYRMTTNNRMELMACIMAINSLEDSSDVVVYCDSSYVVRGITEGWAKRWRANNWIRKNNQPAENADLWSQLLDLTDKHRIDFRWLAGHAGYTENERCDQLARQAARGKYLAIDTGFKP